MLDPNRIFRDGAPSRRARRRLMDVWSRPAGDDRCDSIRERDLVDEDNLTTTRAFRLRPHIAVVRLNRPDYRMMRDARLRRALFS